MTITLYKFTHKRNYSYSGGSDFTSEPDDNCPIDTKSIVDIFKQTMEEYKINYNQTYIDTDYMYDLNPVTHKELQGLKKFKKRAIVLIDGNNGRMHPSRILISKKHKRPINEHYADTTVENIMQYI